MEQSGARTLISHLENFFFFRFLVTFTNVTADRRKVCDTVNKAIQIPTHHSIIPSFVLSPVSETEGYSYELVRRLSVRLCSHLDQTISQRLLVGLI